MPSKRNIIVGASRVYIGPSITPATATGLKATTTTRQTTHMEATAQVNAGWRDVGYTQDGLEVANDPSWGEVEVDQLLDAAKIFKDGMGFTVSTTMAEATLENLLVAWGQSSSFLTGSPTGNTENEIELEGGALGQAPFERGLVAVGNGPEKADGTYSERTYFVHRVLSVDAATHGLNRAEATTFPVSFRALPNDNGKYGSVRDRLGTLT